MVRGNLDHRLTGGDRVLAPFVQCKLPRAICIAVMRPMHGSAVMRENLRATPDRAYSACRLR
jgi:hypothetical protein